MTTKRDRLYSDLCELIDSYSPEYIDQCDESNWLIKDLLDSIEQFEKEVEEQNEEEKEKYDYK